MKKYKYYERAQHLGAIIWILTILCGLTGVYLKNITLMHLSAYLLILIGIYGIVFYLIFKRAPVLRGVSPKSKVAILGNFVLSALLFYWAYYILTHLK